MVIACTSPDTSPTDEDEGDDDESAACDGCDDTRIACDGVMPFTSAASECFTSIIAEAGSARFAAAARLAGVIFGFGDIGETPSSPG